MAYDEKLAGRVRKALSKVRGWTELRMMGGWGFMVRGNMGGGVHGGRLIARVGPDAYEDALRQPHARPFDLTGPSCSWTRRASGPPPA
jgi:hypothetical protein